MLRMAFWSIGGGAATHQKYSASLCGGSSIGDSMVVSEVQRGNGRSSVRSLFESYRKALCSKHQPNVLLNGESAVKARAPTSSDSSSRLFRHSAVPRPRCPDRCRYRSPRPSLRQPRSRCSRPRRRRRRDTGRRTPRPATSGPSCGAARPVRTHSVPRPDDVLVVGHGAGPRVHDDGRGLAREDVATVSGSPALGRREGLRLRQRIAGGVADAGCGILVGVAERVRVASACEAGRAHRGAVLVRAAHVLAGSVDAVEGRYAVVVTGGFTRGSPRTGLAE